MIAFKLKFYLKYLPYKNAFVLSNQQTWFYGTLMQIIIKFMYLYGFSRCELRLSSIIIGLNITNRI